MLKDHKSAMHLEGVNFDKVIRNSNETEQYLNFLLFYNSSLQCFTVLSTIAQVSRKMKLKNLVS